MDEEISCKISKKKQQNLEQESKMKQSCRAANCKMKVSPPASSSLSISMISLFSSLTLTCVLAVLVTSNAETFPRTSEQQPALNLASSRVNHARDYQEPIAERRHKLFGQAKVAMEEREEEFIDRVPAAAANNNSNYRKPPGEPMINDETQERQLQDLTLDASETNDTNGDEPRLMYPLAAQELANRLVSSQIAGHAPEEGQQTGSRRTRRRVEVTGDDKSDRLRTIETHSDDPNAESTTRIFDREDGNGNNNNVSKSLKLKCRVERNLYLDFTEYQHYSCANCYNNMPKKLFWTKFVFKKESRIWLFDELSGQSVLPNETEIIRATFKADSTFAIWRDCCSKAIECCLQNSIYLPKTEPMEDQEPSDFCPATWDGLGCWPESPAGQVAQHHCPDNVYFFGFVPVCRGTVTKQCFSNGSWFIRNHHEWSDYSNCAPLPLYATRMLIGSVWHVISAIVIGPALIVLNRFPNRGGSKRVRILSNLLFWLLLNGSMAALHKIGVIGGIFLPGNDYDDPPTPPPAHPISSLLMAANSSNSASRSASSQGYAMPLSQLTTAANPRPRRDTRSTSVLQVAPQRQQLLASWVQRLDQAKLYYGKLATSSSSSPPLAHDSAATTTTATTDDDDDVGHSNISPKDGSGRVLNGRRKVPAGPLAAKVDYAKHINGLTDNGHKAVVESRPLDTVAAATTRDDNEHRIPPFTSNKRCSSAQVAIESQARIATNTPGAAHEPRELLQLDSPTQASSTSGDRCKRSTSAGADPSKTQPAPVVFICWLLSLGIRITRLLGYAWMFTGAVYLCSILHFAPAEPPNSFIKWLMILTDGFPLTMGLVYLIARTIHEPSPLTLIVKLPYYYIIDNNPEAIDELWATQLNCWMFRSKYDNIEEIADFPNLVLVILNAGLFVVTLIIMCRISRPGCTRQVMSLGDYFKAAGTLVVLYGAHYALFAYRPTVEGCIKGQVMYYAFLFVDGIQGMAVSYVFCYRTAEGKEIICKWLSSCRDRGPKWCQLSDGSKQQQHHRDYNNNHHHHHHHHENNNKSSTLSTRSNNSACNGKEVTTELIDIDENPVGSQF